MENKFPKNVRQIGNVSDTPKIYVEDYVDTFLNQICDKADKEQAGAFLVGKKEVTEGQECLYIFGAICMEFSDDENEIISQENFEKAEQEKVDALQFIQQTIEEAKKKGIKVIAITNHSESPLALLADYHIKTTFRQRVLQSEYYFSRVAAMSVIELLFLLLIVEDKQMLESIKNHEELIAVTKI